MGNDDARSLITRHWRLCAYAWHAACRPAKAPRRSRTEAAGQCGEDRGAHDGCVVIVTTAARQISARSYRPHVGLARQIPVGNSPLCMGSSRSQAVKRTSDNIKSNKLIRLGGGQYCVTCQMHNSPTSTGTSSKLFDMWLVCATVEEIAAAEVKRAFDPRYASGETVS
jgi:hypothetical protein